MPRNADGDDKAGDQENKHKKNTLLKIGVNPKLTPSQKFQKKNAAREEAD